MSAPTIYWPAKAATPENAEAWQAMAAAAEPDDFMADLYAEWAEADANDRQQDNDLSGDPD